MTMNEIKNLLTSLPQKNNLQLLVFRFQIDGGARYAGHHIAFSQYADLVAYAKDVSDFCCCGSKAPLNGGVSFRKYDGQKLENRFSTIKTSDDLVSNSWQAFVSAMNAASREGNPIELLPNAIVLTSVERNFFLVSIQRPVLNFKQRRILFGKRRFRRLSENQNILTLSSRIDVVATAKEIVFFSEAGVRFFVSDSSIKQAAFRIAGKIADCSWVSDSDSFKREALSSRHAVRLLAVTDERLEKLEIVSVREKIAKVFGLNYGHGKFATKNKSDIAGLIKVLGKRGMFDVVESIPVEVSGTDDWKKEV